MPSLKPPHLFLQDRPSPPVVVDRPAEMPRQQSQPRVLYAHPTRADVLIDLTEDGPDYILFCVRHQYAAPAVVHYMDLGCCPLCLAEIEAVPGRSRYAALQNVEIKTGLR